LALAVVIQGETLVPLLEAIEIGQMHGCYFQSLPIDGSGGHEHIRQE
jgi:hypothetical protein